MAELSPISVSNLSNRIHFSSSSPPINSSQLFSITAKRCSNCRSISRRLGLGLIALMASSSVASTPVRIANALDLKLIAPEQSFEEAESGIRGHAEAVLQVRGLIESESWKEAQKQLRTSSPLLKQDLYTIIEYKPPAERPPLRKLYSLLFNNVTRMDYAARDKDAERVRQCYDNIVMAISDILSRI
ncbi:psbQ-like protein 3, chloroplastic isoform X1 [Cucurbita moschata]|uniref:PsbQ-like protein 3, chloroplastic isoform X1 n=1 Tax=Cucurbita moschata TaxID=3662 RepID=A0A6J1HES6_CUCMO|nr:psbQ-like protein 3, chloroplastic isoform X1 [Cucurbita moschata]